MNIVFVDFDDIQNQLLGAGQARATYEVGKRLCAMGHKVTVFCSKYPGYKDRTQDGIMYRHIGLASSYIRLNNLFYILSAPFIIRKIKADVIIESFVAPISTLCSPLFTKVPVIGLPSMFNAQAFAKKYYLPFHWIERFGSKCYKYFLPYSDVDSAKMKKLNPRIKYKIVPQGVDESFFNIKRKQPRHILFLSRFDIEQKGIDLLLKAYAKVTKKIAYPLVLAGHGTDENKIKTLITSLGLEKRVTLVGSAYGKKKEDLLAHAIFVAFPSRHDELSLWALEALASSLPLVGFDIPECRWITGDVSLKAKPFDTSEYAKLLLKASDKKINDSMRKNARLLAREYSWENVATLFDSFIREVLAHENNSIYKQPMTMRKTKLSKIIEIPKIFDEGYLCVAEERNHLPFNLKRFYFIYDVFEHAKRGFHAHKKTKQILFCISGSIKIILDNGEKREEIFLTEPNQGIYLDSMMWHEMVDFKKDTVLLVAASQVYDEDDYIRDYALFLKYARRRKKANDRHE